MSSTERNPKRPATSARAATDEDDHDLLTFGEAGERLRIEIAEAERLIDELQRAGDTGALATAMERLDALQKAARRNSAQPINDANFEAFFGYPGKAKRNLSDATG